MKMKKEKKTIYLLIYVFVSVEINEKSSLQ